MGISEIREILIHHGLKITPQRIAVIQAISSLKNHPTADQIINLVQRKNPNIAVGTIYKTLETFVEKKILKKVKTDKDTMRYDHIMESHHHLYGSDCDRIEDYVDHELDELLESYFHKKGIPDFEIEEIKLQINGKFKNK